MDVSGASDGCECVACRDLREAFIRYAEAEIQRLQGVIDYVRAQGSCPTEAKPTDAGGE
ncbi:hypothetical protein M0R72_10615 [Candidatus Pacearchaeota archaeon]|nr:hypothetical protein [Candidatus Pacearchaeota archaeon]